MNDHEFMAQIIAKICDYAVKNKMEPNDTLRTIAENIDMMLEISNFNNWQPTNVAAQGEKKLIWHSVKDDPPKEEQDVLLRFSSNMAVGFLRNGIWRIYSGGNWATDVFDDDELPQLWMPLPEDD